ncbi:MAG: hypothetical protein BWK79_05845 [Beggiatoa sp. IS2]|nr:MAG: hypothetical protein BWK79_05845 [Beggiatoa sp. IS2]
MLRITLWMILVFACAITLIVPNAHLAVSIHYFVGRLEINLALLLFLSLSLGILLGIIFNLIWVWNLRRDNFRLKKLYKQMFQQIGLSPEKQDTT